MPLKSEQKELYPLELCKIYGAGQRIYDRDTREKSYFYLAFISEGVRFITAAGRDFCISDGGFFSVRER